MPFITTKHDNDQQEVSLFYEDYGEGRPVILIHGWPSSHRMWEQQTWALVEAGYRVIAYDRRGFGLSSFPWNNYDYDQLAADLQALIQQLDLKNVTLVGFSMGGGEVVRYLTKYGDDKISQAVLLSSIIPLVAEKEDNPAGVPEKNLNDILDALETDRVGFLREFFRNFFNADKFKDKISEGFLHYHWSIASYASPRGTIEAAKAWAGTDFRPELKNVTVPTLIIHGTDDQIVPIETSADQAAAGIATNRYEKIKDAPHGCVATHPDKINELLTGFLKEA